MFFFSTHSEVRKERLFIDLEQKVKLEKTILLEKLEKVAALTLTSAETIDFVKVKNEDSVWNSYVYRYFKELIEHNIAYLQIRYIDKNGHEVIRVERQHENLHIAPKKDLQNKSNSLYFQTTKKLNPHQVYISDIDLNMEHGKVASPFQPVIRVASPVYSSNGFEGIIIINLDMARFLENAHWQFGIASEQLLIANKEGFWIRAVNKGHSWGHNLKDRAQYNLKSMYESYGGSPTFFANNEGRLHTEVGLNVYSYVNLNDINLCSLAQICTGLDDNKFLFIGHISEQSYSKYYSQLFFNYTLLAALLSLIGFMIALFVARLGLKNDELQAEVVRSGQLSMVGQLAAGVAHEINNPLMVLKGHSRRLIKKIKEGAVDEGLLSKSINIQLKAIDRIAAIVRQLRVQRKNEDVQLNVVNINQIVQEALDFTDAMYSNLGIKFQVSLCPSDECCITGDSGMLMQVLLNILANAKDAVEKNDAAEISISIRQSVKMVSIIISDNGEGMDSSTKQRIFETFFTTKEVGKGTGLGLGIVYSMIQNMKGKIEVDSELGMGTTFKLMFSKCPCSGEQ